MASGTEAAAALRRWQASEPTLATIGSLEDVVTAAHRRGDGEANDVLRALIRLAGADPVARRCLLQALMPGLVRLCGRFPFVGDGPDERLANVLTLALERIGELAGSDVAYPAAAVAWRVRDRLRRAELAHQRAAAVPVGDLGAVGSARVGRSADEELTAFLVDGVRRGTLRAQDAALVYTTRVVGVPCHVLAAERGVDAVVLRTRRRRAERQLAAAIADWC